MLLRFSACHVNNISAWNHRVIPDWIRWIKRAADERRPCGKAQKSLENSPARFQDFNRQALTSAHWKRCQQHHISTSPAPSSKKTPWRRNAWSTISGGTWSSPPPAPAKPWWRRLTTAVFIGNAQDRHACFLSPTGGRFSNRFWRKGHYDIQALEKVYSGAHVLALQRFNVIVEALHRYEPELSLVRGIGFCVSVAHAQYMAEMFNRRGIPSATLLSETDDQRRGEVLRDFRGGKLVFLFTRDVLNEGLDVPEINTVLFLRPTDSLTVFLQQPGRGLRHAAEKDCLTVLDFVGQAHKRYRLDSKFKALLRKNRFAIDREVEMDFPHLPAGCSIQLDRVAREYVLKNIRENLRRLRVQVPERLQTFARLMANPTVLQDMDKILTWAEDRASISGTIADLPFPCPLELHGQYSNIDILANPGLATFESAGQRGVGVIHCHQARAHVLLVTYQKTERESSPSTMYADYPISRDLLHWESQSNTTQSSNTGQNLTHHAERRYTILIFARNTKKNSGVTLPYTYLGPAERVSYEEERPIKMIWRLQYPMPAEMFDENRRGG